MDLRYRRQWLGQQRTRVLHESHAERPSQGRQSRHHRATGIVHRRRRRDSQLHFGSPKCGEIDIMENIGKEPGTVHGSLHGPSTSGPTSDLSAPFSLPAGQNFGSDFHLYAVEWEPGTIRFYVDTNLYATFTSSQWPAGGAWVFDHPFFIILNVAVGGNWPGSPDSTT